MAAGDRKIKIQEFHIQSGNPVPFSASWQLFVEDKLGADRYITGGITVGTLGTVAAFNALTGLQIRTNIKNSVIADVNVPSNDSVT